MATQEATAVRGRIAHHLAVLGACCALLAALVLTGAGPAAAEVPLPTTHWGTSGDIPVPGKYAPGDTKADLTVYRPSTGDWWIMNTQTHVGYSRHFGGSFGDKPVPGDYDGDGVLDLAIFNPISHAWKEQLSSTGQIRTQTFGTTSADVPVVDDYDRDGHADIAYWVPSTGDWHVIESHTGAQRVVNWGTGTLGDIPVLGRFMPQARSNFTVYRPGPGTWFTEGLIIGPPPLNAPFNLYLPAVQYGGVAGDIPVSGHFSCSDQAVPAIFRPATGTWFVQGLTGPNGFGTRGDIPATADYFGDSRTDFAYFHPSTGDWHFASNIGGTCTPV